MKALADALGERRDRDVTIAALERLATAMASGRPPGLRSLIEALQVEQTQANVALEPFVTEERIAALGERLDELVAEARALVPSPPRRPRTRRRTGAAAAAAESNGGEPR